METKSKVIACRPITPSDREWVVSLVTTRWGADKIVVHEDVYRPSDLPGFIAELDDRPVGLVTYRVSGDECEIITLDSLKTGIGIGTALVSVTKRAALAQGCQRLRLVTTNDNLRALRFYQKRGFRLVELRPGVVDESRKIKPVIPVIGQEGIPLHDELDLVLNIRN